MSAQNAAPLESKQLSGAQTVLRYTGIPTSWLNKRPKLPSRNWLIFLSVTSSIAGLYFYDRRECKRIQQYYVDLVKDQAEVPIGSLDLPRRVTVYGSKWPGDEDYDQAIKHFRRYVKPILVAAAVDYEMFAGQRHGDIADRVAEQVRLRRRMDLGIDSVTEATKALPTYKGLSEQRRHELEGGIVIVGRPTLKEYMAGLKRGWTEGLDKVDKEELLAQELEDDRHFDEPEEPDNDIDSPSPAEKSLLPNPQSSPVYSPLQLHRISTPTSPSTPQPSSLSASANIPPSEIPPQPPLLFVPFTNYIGFTQIPIMIWDFFNQRHKVRSGAEAGYRLVMNHTRPFIPPPTEPESVFIDTLPGNTSESTSPSIDTSKGDLDFDKHVESVYKKSLASLPADIEKARKKFYDEIPAKLATARALARGTREPTKAEIENPPPTEVELRAERMKKELRWRHNLGGWDIVKPDTPAVWDDRFNGALRVSTSPADETELRGTTLD